MSPSQSLIDLLEAWEAAFRTGLDRAPEELAPDAPDLWDELRDRIDRRKRLFRFLDLGAGADRTAEQSVDLVGTSDRDTGTGNEQPRGEVAELLRHLGGPQAAGELGR